MNLRTLLVLLACSLIASGVAWSAWRVSVLERSELEHESTPTTLSATRDAPDSTNVSARLAEMQLRAGEHALFEVCSDDGMPEHVWRGALDLVVFQLDPLKLLLRVPLDLAYLGVIKRNRRGACLTLGSGVLDTSGKYAVDAVWPGKEYPQPIASASLRVRVLARHPLQPLDRAPVWMIACGALCLVLALFATGAHETTASRLTATPQHTAIAIVIGLGVVVAGWLASALLGPAGPTWGLLKTAGLALLQVAAAIGLARWLADPDATHAQALALHAPRRAALISLAVAPVVGWALTWTARWSLRLVPSTGESAIETFISWPSGMLAFAAIGALVPLCEELFFRGFVYGHALRFGPVLAFVTAAASFTLLHAAQTWGNWGSLLAITITGTVLTGLRAGTGSTLIPALAHIVYNLSLSLRSL